MPKLRARWLVVLALSAAILTLSAALLSFGQGKKLTADHEEPDHPRERDQWFRRGRPSDGGVAAQKLNRAYQQKMALRAKARARLSSAQITAAASASAALVPANGATWTALGPAPVASDSSGAGSQDYGPVTGRATAVVIDQNDPTGNTVYLGGAYGGLWKSTNAANPTVATCATGTPRCAPNVTWTPLIDGEATLAVGSIALKPDNSQVILVGTGESNSSADSYYGMGILRSTQGGAPGSWTLITSADAGAHPFRGLTFSRIAFNNDPGKTNVVVASAAASGTIVGGEQAATTRGLYFSTDAGATWALASALDAPGVAPNAGSTHSVVYHPAQHKFYAALRAHGIYSSPDGANWTRLAAQPGSITLQNCPSVTNLQTCPLYRAELAVVPGRDEMYVWMVDLNDKNGGLYQTRDGGVTWTQVPTSAIAAVGSQVDQGTYNLDLAAIPDGTGTDLYAGAVDQWKCKISDPLDPSTCSFVNLTHVYECTPFGSYSHVHPDEHSIDFLHAGTAADFKIVYFANDGGVYRTLNSFAPATGVCGTTGFPFDNLNANMGSMTQFVWFSHHPTDASTLLGGTQDNGAPATGNAGTTQAWVNVNNADVGFNDIDPSSPNVWYTNNTYMISGIQRCASGINCTSGSFVNTISQTKVGGDFGSFYVPYMLDPQNPGKVIVGTCRVWRGNSDGSGWTSANALSPPNFSSLLTAACPKGDATNPPYNADNISALAAGGPKGCTSNASRVIYAGTEGGNLWVATDAESGTPATWTSRTSSINPNHYPISSVAIDPTDGTGLSAYVAIMGFDVGHVFHTTDGGVSWTNISGDLPNAPADAVLVDPATPSIVYVGTDVGVFATSNGGANWTEVGLSATAASTFPNVAITRMRIFSGGSTQHLRVSTYGRGVWDIDLGTVAGADFRVGACPASTTISAGSTATHTITLTPQGGPQTTAMTLSCSGLPALSSCSFSPASVTLGASPATSTLTISTTAATGAVRPLGRTGPMYALWLPLAGVVLAGAGHKRRRAFFMVLALWCVVSMLLLLQACGGGNGGGGHAGTPAGTYTITVNASLPTVTRSTTVTLTVQ